MSIEAGAGSATMPDMTRWWSQALADAARHSPGFPLQPDLILVYPFLAWLAAALGTAALDEAGAPAVAEALRGAGLREAEGALPLRILGPGLDPSLASAPGLLLEMGPLGPLAPAAGRDSLLLAFGQGMRISAPRGLGAGALAYLLSQARDLAQAEAASALFEALGERLAARLELDTQRRTAARETEQLQRSVARTEASLAAEAARRRTIEESTAWRVSRVALNWIGARPRLASFLRRAARLTWHRVVRPLLRRRRAEPVAIGTTAVETTFCITGVGAMVFATAPSAGLAITGLTVLEDGVRHASLAPPKLAPTTRIGRTGLAAFVPGAGAATASGALELRLADGSVIERPMPGRLLLEPREAIKAILSRLDPAADGAPALLREQILPAIEACWAMAKQAPVNVNEVVLGTPPARPGVSLVVPLYGRMDWILLQCALFSNDPGLLAQAELIYVLDDPERAAEAMKLAEVAFRVYGVPLRMLRLSRNLGYSGATNAGARAARGERLLLLNSDVLPLAPGWLDHLVASHQELPHCGALGCRLIFDDGTLQHVGMAFQPEPNLEAWICDHPLKGEAAERDRTTLPRQVPAVTGACLMVGRDLYAALGGLSEDYVIGDFEDADLCHRLIEAGHRIWYDPRVTLIHFERQSLVRIGSSEWRYALTLCNMLLHARRWRKYLQTLVPLRSGSLT